MENLVLVVNTLNNLVCVIFHFQPVITIGIRIVQMIILLKIMEIIQYGQVEFHYLDNTVIIQHQQLYLIVSMKLFMENNLGIIMDIKFLLGLNYQQHQLIILNLDLHLSLKL